MTAQPPKIHSKPALQLLMDNVHQLRHPSGVIKHPYFQTQFAAPDSVQGIREMQQKFAEAILLLLQDNPEVLIPIMTAGGYKCIKARAKADA